MDRYENLLSIEKLLDGNYKLIESDKKKSLRITILNINGKIIKELKYK